MIVKPLISVVVPCHNEEAVLPLFWTELSRVTAKMTANILEPDAPSFEFLFVDDGSSDGTLPFLKELAALDNRVKYLSFSRNFGKEAGMYAGLQHSAGDYVVIMDADLQHPPCFLPEMYEAVRSGQWDCASTRRITRKGEPKLLSFFARRFYQTINKISQTEIVDGAQDFRFMSRKMVNAVLSLGEVNRFSKGIFSWVGFRTKYLPYENVKRAAGTSTWNFWKLFLYSLEGICAFSTAPLALSSLLGLICCAVALLAIVWVVFKTILFGEPVAGFPTLICAVFLMGGLQLFCIGILGQYLSKTYLETKRRPIYLVREDNLSGVSMKSGASPEEKEGETGVSSPPS